MHKKAYRTFTKIDHMLAHKTSLNKFQRIEHKLSTLPEVLNLSSTTEVLKLRINNSTIPRKSSKMGINNTILHNILKQHM